MSFWNVFRGRSKRDTATSLPSVKEDISEFKEEQIREWFASCGDVTVEKAETDGDNGTTILLIYCPSLCDIKQIHQLVSPDLQGVFTGSLPVSLSRLESQKNLAMKQLSEQDMKDEIIKNVFSGQLLLLFEGTRIGYTLDIAAKPQRTPEEPNTEISIRGPKDGFVEELAVNVGLVRKRLRTTSLHYETFTIGTRTKTEVGLFFIQDIAPDEVIKEVRKRLQSITIDGILSATALKELIADTSFPIFPSFVYTGRPDFVAESLLCGRFALIVDGVPTAIIAPANLTFILKSSEDVHDSFFFVSFERILRLFGLMVSLLLPGFWIALTTYHTDELPFTMLATTVLSRQGVPFPTSLECFLMLFLFELFREAGNRLPQVIGQTLSVVGGLIIGQAAISAGLASAGLLVVVATSLVATFTLVNLTLTGTVSILRMGIVLASSLLGMFGFLVSVFAVLTYLANLRSFGVPYLAPLSPPTFGDIKQAIITVPWKQKKKRPAILQPQDPTRRGEDTQ